MKNLSLFACLIIFLACKKNDPSVKDDELKSQFILDSITYKDYGADLYYRLLVQGGRPPYSYVWNNPSNNIGNGPFHIKLKNSFDFDGLIVDSNNNLDSIKYSYDYRDKIIGQYICKFHNWDYGNTLPYSISYDTTFIDTILISKYPNNLISAVSTSFNVDSLWDFWGFYYQNHHIFKFDFDPKNDSINLYIMDGGLGGGRKSQYYGHKITN